MTISYTITSTPIGPLLLAATDKGLVRVAFECEKFELVLGELELELGSVPVEDPQRLSQAASQLAEYFADSRHEFDLELDHSLSSGFRLDVQKHLAEIKFGNTESYTEVAEQVGSPKAVRAVGSACATNPIPIVLPCHRVLRSDGTLGGYRGGLEIKTKLLEMENAA